MSRVNSLYVIFSCQNLGVLLARDRSLDDPYQSG